MFNNKSKSTDNITIAAVRGSARERECTRNAIQSARDDTPITSTAKWNVNNSFFLFSLRRLEDDAFANFLLAADLRVILVPVLAAKIKLKFIN